MAEKGISMEERRILIIGKTGVGKSTTGNTLLGKDEFKTALFGKSVTTNTTPGEAVRFGKKLIVVDTPGLYDTRKENADIMMETCKCYNFTSPGLHAIVLVIQIGRITQEDNQTLEFYLEKFGPKVTNYLVIAFTGKSKLDEEGINIYDFIETLDEEGSLKKLLKDKNRFVVFGRNKDKDKRDEQADNLLKTIESMVEDNDGKFYTNEMYEETEKIIKKRLEEDKRKEKEKFEKDVEEAIKKRTQEEKQIEQQKSQERLDLALIGEEYRRTIQMQTGCEAVSLLTKTVCQLLIQYANYRSTKK